MAMIVVAQVLLWFLMLLGSELYPEKDTGFWPVTVFFSIGWTQLVYLLPYAHLLRRKGRKAKAKGVLMTVGAFFLLTSACNLVFAPVLG